MSLLGEIREAILARVFRTRLQAAEDKGMLAGLDTALEAVKLHTPRSGAARLAIEQAREGYVEEMGSRG
jgi:hypothetical protein